MKLFSHITILISLSVMPLFTFAHDEVIPNDSKKFMDRKFVLGAEAKGLIEIDDKPVNSGLYLEGVQ